ncbi:MAG: class I SAM-dependent methyltransferase, partial [Planctomycetes bacterium]|nr:class I SAM-dependent methyltransferase [Planctomycetota bacterium]
PAAPLAAEFPRVRLYTFSYPANADSLERTLASIRASDWGEEPVVVMQPDDWPRGRESGSRTYKRVLEAAAIDGCDFALILEDDVRVNRHLRHNALSNPLVARDQCDYLGLFMPDLVADPWEREEPHLGYRLAKPRYSGPNRGWERGRVWGSQGYVLSRRLVLAALDRWDRLREGQDTRVIGVCAEFGLPLWYTAPCLVEHAPLVSAFDTPDARAPDFAPDFRLEPGAEFQPPEAVPGWLTLGEARLLWRAAAGRDVLELGTACGRSTVCLGQSARRVVSVDVADQSEAAEWVRRFGCADRVEFRRGDAGEVCRGLSGPFGLIFIDTLHDAASVSRDIGAALPVLAPGGLLAFHDYPDPGWPDVRRVVDEHARRLGWRRVEQVDYLGLFRTG